RNRHHDPEGHAGKATELERRVKSDHERRGNAEYHVKIQPVFGAALPQQPCPALAQRVEEDDQEHPQAEKAELQSYRATGPQGNVLGREGPVGGAQGVVIESVHSEPKNQGSEEKIGSQHTPAVTALAVVGSYNS